MPPGRKRNPPKPKIDLGSEHGDMSDTQMFIVDKIGEAKEAASKAITAAKTAESEAKAVKEDIKNVRDWVKDVNDGSITYNRELTEQIKKLNDNLASTNQSIARIDAIKEGQGRIRSELDGQADRISTHIIAQAKHNAKTDTKLQQLVKGTGKDYDNLESAILSLKTDIVEQMATMKTSFKSDMENAMQEVAPTVLFVKLIKLLISLVVIGSAVIWAVIQTYSWFEKRSSNHPSQTIQAVQPGKQSTVEPVVTTPPKP